MVETVQFLIGDFPNSRSLRILNRCAFDERASELTASGLKQEVG